MFCAVISALRARTLIVISTIALVPTAEFSLAQVAARFDGKWNVTLVCPTDKTAQGYTYRFVAEVESGVLHGEHGTPGKPGWVALDGSIQDSGVAILNAKGLTNIPKFSAYQVQTGTPYTYTVRAQFNRSHGSGRRIEIRACTLEFVRT